MEMKQKRVCTNIAIDWLSYVAIVTHRGTVGSCDQRARSSANVATKSSCLEEYHVVSLVVINTIVPYGELVNRLQ